MASEPGSSAAPLAAPHAGQQAEEAAGAEFFRRRLQRAMAIPPEQRDPAVHAFVTSVQLMEAAAELLPLTADGQPALPADTLAGQQAEVQAMLLAATAWYVAPEDPEWEGKAQDRLGRYLKRRHSSADWDREAAYLPALQPLARVLLQFCFDSVAAAGRSLEIWHDSVEELRHASSSFRAALSQQMQQVQRSCGHRLLTARQWEAAFCLRAARHAGAAVVALVSSGDRSPSAQGALSQAAAWASDSSERLLLLDPGSPKAILCSVPGVEARYAIGGRIWEVGQRGLDLYLSALRAATASGSRVWEVEACCEALRRLLMPGMRVSQDDLAAVVAVAEAAPAVAKQLRGLLPQPWSSMLSHQAEMLKVGVEAGRQRLQSGQSSVTQAAAVLAAMEERTAELGGLYRVSRPACSGCGQPALSLRRCSRCKQAAYCSRDCQVRHWPQHKRECKAPSSSGGS